jgi:ATP-dependent DNA helicase DinG
VPEVPPVPGTLVGLVDRAFADEGPLARALPDFEPREGQVEMARAVARRLESGGVLLAEAGTGTGKTLAYLVPALLSRQRVLVSTGTKNLQEQIYFKDIPCLQQSLGIAFTAACMKGRSNYLCLHRLEQIQEESVFLPIIRTWASRTETGDRAELDELPEDLAFWNSVSATAETCLGTECPRYDDCFVTRMRQRAAAADVVIVNHHLLCADAAVRQNAYGEVIPACANAIIDEAHQLEDVATQYFGYSFSTYRIEDFARDIERLSGGEREIGKAVDRLREDARAFFSDVAVAHRGNGRVAEERIRVTQTSLASALDAAAQLSGAFDVIQSALPGIATRRAAPEAAEDSPEDAAGDGDEAAREDVAALVRRAGELRDELRLLMRADDPAYVYFVEFRGRGGVFLRASPVDVSTIIRELLLDRMRTTVLTSATLTVDGTFEYVRERLGIGEAAEICLPSEFDFAGQAILYLPKRMPDPRAADFSSAAGREVVDILERTRGRAFVLFTSYRMMREVLAVAEMALDFPIFAQGAAPRSELLRQFRATPHSVLFATSSFWQGVDVVGDALSCVVIDKLPFASPAEPVTAARIDAIRERGGDPFGEYQVPLAILSLQQGLGRLIRHRRDRGVLAVLDPRLRTKGYGRRFLKSLPPARLVHDLAEIEAFFANAEARC